MDIRITYVVDGYLLEEIIDETSINDITDEILEGIKSVYIFHSGELLEGEEAVREIKHFMEEHH